MYFHLKQITFQGSPKINNWFKIAGEESFSTDIGCFEFGKHRKFKNKERLNQL